jgi:hypothetical protein
MPANTTGLTNSVLPSDGQFHPFDKYDRYYAESVTGWQGVTFENELTQFICVQMFETTATVFVINAGSGLAEGQVAIFGPTANQTETVVIKPVNYQSYEAYIPGNSGTCVWMNGDSRQNSAAAVIALQQLSTVQLFLNVSGISRLSKMVGKYFTD